MHIIGGHLEITGCFGSIFLQFISWGRGKSYGAFSRVFDISSVVWSIVSPIHGCRVARSEYEALVLYLSTIIEMLLDEQYDAIEWLDIPFIWCHLKTLKHAINEDNPLSKFGIR